MAEPMFCKELVAGLGDMGGVGTHLIGAYVLAVLEYVVKLVVASGFDLFYNNLVSARYWVLPPSVSVEGAVIGHHVSARIDHLPACPL